MQQFTDEARRTMARALGWADAPPPVTRGAYASTYDAIRRSQDPTCIMGRSFWETAALHYDTVRPGQTKDVTRRFQSDTVHHVGACLELLSAVLLPNLGYKLSAPVHDDPDFAATLDGHSFIVECRAVTELDENADAELRRTNAISVAVEEMSLGGIMLSVEINGCCTGQPSKTAIQRRIRMWIAGYPALLAAPVGPLDECEVPSLTWDEDGAEVCVRPVYKVATPDAGALGVCSPAQPIWTNSIAAAVRSSVDKKAKKYSDGPVVLVIGASSDLSSLGLIFDGLFGDLRFFVPRGPGAPLGVSVKKARGADGALYDRQPCRRNVVAVVALAGRLSFPWTSKVAVIPNPYTVHADHLAAVERSMRACVGDGELEELIERQMRGELPVRRLLGLPAEN